MTSGLGTLVFADGVVLLAPSVRGLQLLCEATGMRISTSKSEAMVVLSQRKVLCLLQVAEEILPQVEEFKYLGLLFTSLGKMERVIDRQIAAVSAVMWALRRPVLVKRELG